MRLLEPPAALGAPCVLGTQQVQAHNTKRGYMMSTPGGAERNAAGILPQHPLFLQSGVLADPICEPQELWWHARLALG